MNKSEGARRHKRIAVWSFLIILAGALVMPLAGYLYVNVAAAQAATPQDVNPHANFWRAVRQGDRGYSASSGPYTTTALIQNGGENYRNIRNGPIASIGPWVLAAVLLAILLYFLIHGRTRIEPPRSGRMVERWSAGERLIHWYTAILFILLAITGLSLLFGRAALIPLFGLPGFAAYAQIAKLIHNWSGPLFIVGVILEIVTWIRYNTFKAYDWVWLKKLGGMLSRRGVHPPAGRANLGEKLWFWFIATIGLIGVCGSGLIYDFPNFGQSREIMQYAALIHASLALLWIAISFGHIYLGSIGMEGAFKGMTNGKVPEEWMKQHHSEWWIEMQRRGGEADASAPETELGPGAAST